MANDVVVTVVGRLTDDPALRFVSSGAPVVNFSVAHNSRRFDRTKNEWVDSEVTYYRCSMWGTGAENVTETLRKGSPVIVQGALGTRSWEQNGEKKSAMEMKVERIGLDLSFVAVDPENIRKSGGRGAQQSAPTQQGPDVSAPGGSANDPWAARGADPGEPPF